MIDDALAQLRNLTETIQHDFVAEKNQHAISRGRLDRLIDRNAELVSENGNLAEESSLLKERNNELQNRVRELQVALDVRRDADAGAWTMWAESMRGKHVQVMLPKADHADLVMWLVSQLESAMGAKNALDKVSRVLDDALIPDGPSVSTRAEFLARELSAKRQQARVSEDKIASLTAQLEETRGDKACAEKWGNDGDKALDRAIKENETTIKNYRVLQKLQMTTQEQLDKFMGACADQTIQIMELRGEIQRTIAAIDEAGLGGESMGPAERVATLVRGYLKLKGRLARAILNSENGIKLSTARDVLKNLDSVILKVDKLISDRHVINGSNNHTWSKLRMFASEARDWLGRAIHNAEHPAPPVSSQDTAAEMSADVLRQAADPKFWAKPGNPYLAEIDDELTRQLEAARDKIAELRTELDAKGVVIKRLDDQIVALKKREQDRVDVEVHNYKCVIEQMQRERRTNEAEIASLKERIELLVNPDADRDGNDR